MTIQNKNIIKISDECSDISEEQIELLTESVSKTKEDSKKSKTKLSRCKYTIDLVEDEYGDAYEKSHVNEKPCVNNEHYVNKKQKKNSQSCKQSSQSCKQNIASTLVKQLTKSEIESLRQNKRDAYEIMMKID